MCDTLCFDFTNYDTNNIKTESQTIINTTRILLNDVTDLNSLDSILTIFYNSIMPIQFLRLVSINDEIRTIATIIYDDIQRFELEVVRNERLFNIIKDTITDNPETLRAKQMYQLDFELKGGMNLDPNS